METTAITPHLSTDQTDEPIVIVTPEWMSWVLASILLTVALGIPTNTILLISYIKNPELQSPSNLLLVNQGIADLLSCMVVPLYSVLNYTQIGGRLASINKYLCLVAFCSSSLTVWSSLFNLLWVSIDRLTTIQFPFHHARLVTEARVKWGMALMWVTMVSIHFAPLFGYTVWQPNRPCTAGYVVPPFFFVNLFLIPSYLTLFLVAVLNLAICGIVINKRRVTPNGTGVEQQQQQKQQKSQYKLTKMILVVVGIFFVCWFPYTTITAITLLARKTWFAGGFPPWLVCLMEFCKIPLALNGALNPLIYVWRNGQFRKAFRKTLHLSVANEETPP